MKKVIIITIFSAMLITSISSCAKNGSDNLPEQAQSSENPVTQSPDAAEAPDLAAKPLTPEKWIARNNTVSAWFSEEQPEDSLGADIDPETIHVGKTADGKDIFTLLRLPLQGTWFAGEVRSARLLLKVKENDAPASLRVARAAGGWDSSQTPRAEARALVDDASFSTPELELEEGGWVSFNVTDYVKTWLSGDVQNNGFALFAESAGGTTVFVSGWAEDDIPYLEVSGAVGARASDYGKFGYTEQPVPGAEVDEGGNCLSYALRDTEMILIDDLKADYEAMNKIYRGGGEDAVMDYFAGLVEDYVEENKAGLQISRFRKIDGFDAPFDPEKEYRAAIRRGCKVFDEVDLGGDRNFDFHAWAQLNDGQWAQKFPLDASEKIPCSAPGVSPEKYPWDAAIQWSLARLNGYYTSKIVYFAVTKDTEDFTKHKTR